MNTKQQHQFRKHLTVGVAMAAVLLYVTLNGCAAVEPQELPLATTAAPDSTPTVLEDVSTVTLSSEAINLIRIIGAEGCDPTGVEIARSVTRKGSEVITIGCK